ncbi:hypothetical protein H5410_000611 [Solanum commersonii]|uniref:Uncharacterized protein n=1 Tax=Solanum commersonii TaxID=4109 RepID=A0A9J6AWI6_SOLCO|nr:hypothetical protein H5410_000611 [Solanum commersonii]
MKSNYGVSVLRGTFCFYCTLYRWRNMEGTFQLWIMKDYDRLIFHSIVPKYRFADGDILLCCKLGGHSVFMTSKGPFGLWPQIDIYQDGVVYKESLISPKSLILHLINYV